MRACKGSLTSYFSPPHGLLQYRERIHANRGGDIAGAERAGCVKGTWVVDLFLPKQICCWQVGHLNSPTVFSSTLAPC